MAFGGGEGEKAVEGYEEAETETERERSRLQPRLLALNSWKEGRAIFQNGKGRRGKEQLQGEPRNQDIHSGHSACEMPVTQPSRDDKSVAGCIS